MYTIWRFDHLDACRSVLSVDARYSGGLSTPGGGKTTSRLVSKGAVMMEIEKGPAVLMTDDNNDDGDDNVMIMILVPLILTTKVLPAPRNLTELVVDEDAGVGDELEGLLEVQHIRVGVATGQRVQQRVRAPRDHEGLARLRTDLNIARSRTELREGDDDDDDGGGGGDDDDDDDDGNSPRASR
jgi:hypothetical protein